jgi:hypothetical protein
MICSAIRPSAFNLRIEAALGRCIGLESPACGRKMIGGPAQKVPNFQMGSIGKKVTRIVAITHLMVLLKFG